MLPIAEFVALDLAALREHTEEAGHEFDLELHAARLAESVKICRVGEVRRNGQLAAYAMLNRLSGASWFVRAFNIHPMHHTAPVFLSLLRQVIAIAQEESIADLRSNVYKANRRSMAFHQRLGFLVTKESSEGVEFFATVEELASNPSIERTSSRRPSRLAAAAHVKR